MDRLGAFGILYLAVSLLVAFAIPDAVLTNNSWLRPIVEHVTTVVPSAKAYAAIAHWPEVALVNFVLHWTVFPVLVVAVLLQLRKRRSVDLALILEKGRLVFVLGPFLLLFGFWFVVADVPTPEQLRGADSGLRGMAAGLAGESRLGLGLVSGVFFYCLAIMTGASLKLITLIPSIWRAGRGELDSGEERHNG